MSLNFIFAKLNRLTDWSLVVGVVDVVCLYFGIGVFIFINILGNGGK
jgi:uncharacterized membrane protein